MQFKKKLLVVGFLFVLQVMLTFFSLIEKVEASDFSPYKIESNVKEKRWDIKGANNELSTSGKRLHYDIYKGSNGANKQGYKIETKDFGKGREQFLTFNGWAALVGYMHHNSKNQSTYIIARNEAEEKEKMYRVQITSLDASKDIEYNRKSSTGAITNKCGKDVKNKVNNTCNMEYKGVGFKAWIPLADLFPNPDKPGEWELWIVKRVGTGKDLRVVYDQLIVPFEFSGRAFQKGTITLNSGSNADKLKMLVSDAVRREKARGTANGGNYFTKDRIYSMKTPNKDYTMQWYGVMSPHDSNKTRYAASLYWRSQGTQAVIRYDVSGKSCPDGTVVKKSEPCTVDVTINHVDRDSGILLQREKRKSTVGKSYEYKPKKKGTFTHASGAVYVASPSGQLFEGKTPNNNMNFTFTYRAKQSAPPPDSCNREYKVGGEPGVTGHFFCTPLLRALEGVTPCIF